MSDEARIPTRVRDDRRFSGLSARTFKTHFLTVLWCWAHDTDLFQISNTRADHAELIDKGLWLPVGDGVTYVIEGAPHVEVDLTSDDVKLDTKLDVIDTKSDVKSDVNDVKMRRKMVSDAHVFKLYSSEFLKFWNKYPQRKGKIAAAAAFKAAVDRGVSPDEIVAGAERYAAECVRDGVEPRHIKYAQGWLSDARWEDEDAPAPAHVYDPLPDYDQFLRGER